MPRRNYHEELIKSLKDHDMAVAYLNAAIEEAQSKDDDAQQALLLALRNVVEANGGFAAVAAKADLGRAKTSIRLYRLKEIHNLKR